MNKTLFAIIASVVLGSYALFGSYAVAQTDPVPEVVKQLAGPETSGVAYYPGNWTKIALDDLAAANDIVYLQNPYGVDVIIVRAIVRITTAGGTATAVIDVDIINAATGTGDDIFDGVDANAAAISDSLNSTDNGTNGEGKCWVWEKAGGTNDYVTAKLLVEAAAALVGDLFLQVIPAAA